MHTSQMAAACTDKPVGDPNTGARVARANVRAGLFEVLRQLELGSPHLPRIGTARRVTDDIVSLVQVPSMDFPGEDATLIEGKDGHPHVQQQIFGLFGLQGALPLAHTREAAHWHAQGESGFTDFVTFLTVRLMQLRYRVWADGRSLRQFGHLEGTAFEEALEAMMGEAYLPDPNKRRTKRHRHACLANTRFRGAARLRGMLRDRFGLVVGVREFLPCRLPFEQDDRTKLGQRLQSRFPTNRLGKGAKLGRSAHSTAHRIGIDLHLQDVERHTGFLPGGAEHEDLIDLTRGYLGPTMDVEVSVWLPKGAAPRACLGIPKKGAAHVGARPGQARLSRLAALPIRTLPADHGKPIVDYRRPIARFALALERRVPVAEPNKPKPR